MWIVPGHNKTFEELLEELTNALIQFEKDKAEGKAIPSNGECF